MNSVQSMSPRGFSTSAWQALERAAVKRRSAATVFKLLARLVQPAASTSATDSVRSGGMPATQPEQTAMPSHTLDAPFERWAALTDAYAEQFLRMQRGDKTARDKAISLSNEMLRMNEAMK
ncbi:MAG: hypothetical protein EOP72_01585 [Variovorax sp.]|jgi:hypothetical protein|nr:MAG: hypothetical protein EOP72_01585 [Variovorax sp.]